MVKQDDGSLIVCGSLLLLLQPALLNKPSDVNDMTKTNINSYKQTVSMTQLGADLMR